ncbi:SIS domain-containing protein [Luteimonas sp. SJ-92]|uniref:SIS domain-containing protein n=1 Tax=Luteimonas salinisoli TaxID=2752307 RepID=A0A853J849_9GAMM|nr:SIS domain-containing protein [Luteimonas salinisoli]NZA24840.1 SIS domain-containing protein [Luteimonas salinisoli]
MPPTESLGISETDLIATGAVCTAREIAQQPRMLERTHALVSAIHARLQAFVAPVTGNPRARVILTGAGTSAYIGQCLAPLLDRSLAARVDAVPTTDIVSAPRLYLDADQPLLLVSFGRSGNSPESIAAMELAESLVADVRHLVVTCNPAGALCSAPVATAITLQLPEETHDASFAMTSSFSCMMYATLAALGEAGTMDGRIGAIAEATRRAISDAHAPLGELAACGYDRVAYLGSGVLQGLAREAALKLGELTNGTVATCFDSPLGFRHGPKTFITARTLVMVFVSNDPLTRRYDHDLIDELRRDGRAARVIEVTAQPRQAVDPDTIAVPGMAGAADVDLLWPFVVVAQLYAFEASRALGLSPDNPNTQGLVNRVVQGVRLYAPTA